MHLTKKLQTHPRLGFPVMFNVNWRILLCYMTLISFLVTGLNSHLTKVTKILLTTKLRGLCGLQSSSKEQKEFFLSPTGNKNVMLALYGHHHRGQFIQRHLDWGEGWDTKSVFYFNTLIQNWYFILLWSSLWSPCPWPCPTQLCPKQEMSW